MSKAEITYTDPEILLEKIDWEGWPDALEWFSGDIFKDPELNALVHEALQDYGLLQNVEARLMARLNHLVGDDDGQT